MSEMEERVEKAIEEWALGRRPERTIAGAAMAAMREPTTAMIDAGYQAFCRSVRPRGLRFIDAHIAMIDAMLAEKEPVAK